MTNNLKSTDVVSKKDRKRKYVIILFILIVIYLTFDSFFVSTPRTSLRNFMTQPIPFDIHYNNINVI